MRLVLLLLTSAACGRLGFDAATGDGGVSDATDGRGGGDACPAGGCPPVAIATFGTHPVYLAMDAANVYWTNVNDTVMQCPRSGCGAAPLVLAMDQTGANGIAVDGAAVYWANYNFQNGSSVERCAIGGCGGTPVDLATGQTPFEVAVDGADVYWTNFNQRTVERCAKGGCSDTPTPIANNVINAWGIALDATYAYWTINTGTGGVQRCAKVGCGAPDDVVIDQVNPNQLVLDGTRMYWAEAALGRVHACDLGDCGGTDTLLTDGEDTPAHVAFDASRVYWVNDSGEVRACEKSGGSGAVTIAAGQDAVSGLAVDERAIVWGRTGAIVVLAK